MKLWEWFARWLDRHAEAWQEPDYDRPDVLVPSDEDETRAEQAVRTFEAYVRVRTARREPPRRP